MSLDPTPSSYPRVDIARSFSVTKVSSRSRCRTSFFSSLASLWPNMVGLRRERGNVDTPVHHSLFIVNVAKHRRCTDPGCLTCLIGAETPHRLEHILHVERHSPGMSEPIKRLKPVRRVPSRPRAAQAISWSWLGFSNRLGKNGMNVCRKSKEFGAKADANLRDSFTPHDVFGDISG